MSPILYMPDNVEINATQERQAKAPMYGAGSGRPLGGRSGFRVGTTGDILTATSTTWTLKPCSAQIDPGASTSQGMYGWASPADITGTMQAAHDTYARKDILYIQVNDSTAGDGTAGTPSAPVLYLAGTATATPVAPDLPPRSFLVGTIDVPKAGGGSPTTTLNPARFVSAGGVLPIGSKGERDLLVPYVGMQISRTDRGGWIQTYTGENTTSGWEYLGRSRRVYADVSGTNLGNEAGSAARLIYTMPGGPLTKPYPQTVNVGARAAISCPAISSGQLQEWLCVSALSGSIAGVQGRASVTFTASASTTLQSLQAETGPLAISAGIDPTARMWIDRPAPGSSLTTTVSADPTFTQMWVDLRPQDD